MLRFFRNSKILPVILLLLVVGTISGKDLLHSFVQHETLICSVHHEGQANSNDLTNTKVEKNRFCAFCHLDNFTFTTSEQIHAEGDIFYYYAPAIIHYEEPVFSNSVTVQQLRGPPVTA